MDDTVALKLLQTGNTMIPNLILKNYVKLGMNAEEFVFLLELKAALKDGNQAFDLQTIAQIMNKDEAQIYQLLHGLIEKGIISLTSVVDDQGRNSDQYSLEPLYKKTLKLLRDQTQAKQIQAHQQTRNDVFARIEQEFGHPLSSFDMEMIDSWLNEDHYSPEIVILALKEAVLSGVYNLKYMDKILLAWEKKGIKTAADVQRQRTKFRHQGQSQRKQGNRAKPKIPLNKWSE